VSAVREELERLLDDLPDEDLVELVAEVRGRAELRAQGVLLKAEGYVTPPPTVQRSMRELRWPHLGPAAVGTAVLLGWFVGLVGGPLVAILGAVLGLVLGDQLDQRTAAAADT